MILAWLNSSMMNWIAWSQVSDDLDYTDLDDYGLGTYIHTSIDVIHGFGEEPKSPILEGTWEWRYLSWEGRISAIPCILGNSSSMHDAEALGGDPFICFGISKKFTTLIGTSTVKTQKCNCSHENMETCFPNNLIDWLLA